jgi:hypothetical protein
MRGLRSFVLLLVIALGLGGYVYFVESKRDPSSGDAREKVFAGTQADAIQEIAVKSEKGERTALKKTDGTWQIVEPAKAPSDSAEVSGITSNLSNLEMQSVIDEKPQDLKQYGLDPARVEVAFKAGGQERRLLIGRKTPPGTDLYAKLGDNPRVFLVSSYLDSTFNRSTFDLRDKAVLAVDRDSIEAVTITAGDRSVRFNKAGNNWRIAAPIEARADSSAVEGLVNRLGTLQMKSIAAPDAKSLAEFGLDKPSATVQLGAGSSQATLLLGKSAGEAVVYARDASKPMVVTVDAGLLEDLKKEPGTYRQTDLFDARAFNASHLDVTTSAGTVKFEKARAKNKDGQEEERWRQIAPTQQDVDNSKLDALLTAVTQTRATSFVESVDKTGLDKPELTATVKSDEGKREETVRYARSGSEAYAARSGEGGAAKIDAAAVEGILKALQDLQQKPAETPAKKN